MNGPVYLSELDSIIYTKEDLKAALDKLYEVLVEKLDIVVVTINQIADSALFNLWLEEKEQYMPSQWKPLLVSQKRPLK